MQVKSLGKGLISLLLAADCRVCQRPLEPSNFTFVCLDCWSKIKWLQAPYCSKCSKPLPFSPTLQDVPTLLCSECGRQHFYFKKVFIPTLYEGVMKKVIHLLKYNKKTGIMRSLKRIIKSYFDHLDFSFSHLDLVVPIPLHPRKLKERGFNQAELIARVIARYLQVKLAKGNLRRVKATITQTTLSRKERIKNIKKAFEIKDKDEFQAKSVLLVDDVYTTGTTIREAAKVLKQAGAEEVYVFTLARAPQTPKISIN